MSAIFRDHIVICGWNPRGSQIVRKLLEVSSCPIVVVAQSTRNPIVEIGRLERVFVISGDCSSHKVLMEADVGHAKSVIVLADETLGQSADAKSVKVALAVERIQVTVHTIVELVDISNKSHFAWTKVDEVVAAEELSVKLTSRAISHILNQDQPGGPSVGYHTDRPSVLGVYCQLLGSSKASTQIVRLDLEWSRIKRLRFGDLLKIGIEHRMIPMALVGYQKHAIAARPEQPAWVSWKSEVYPNPPADKRIEELWPNWPSIEHPLGVLVLAEPETARSKGVDIFSGY